MNGTLYGLVAEFEDPHDLLHAAEAAREAGYRKMDAYTPFPVHGLAEAMEFDDWRLPWLIFLAGCTGAFTGLSLESFTSVFEYPWNVGGKPFFSWPQFIPIIFELTILFAAGACVLGMLGLNGLPRPHHPIFSAPHFDRASQDRFFLCIESRDGMFDRERTEDFLLQLGPQRVSEVEN
jgi:hypothetical protein